MLKNIDEAKIADAKITAKALCDFTWANACEVMENISFLQYESKTDFVFAFNQKMYIVVKGDDIRIGSAAMAFDVTPKQIADDFDKIAGQYFKDYFKKDSLNGLKYYTSESEDVVDAKEASWIEDFAF
jgi:hypothetical protein